MRMFRISLALVLLLTSPCLAVSDSLDAVLQTALLSIIATDMLQTPYWLSGTPDRPVTINDTIIYEVNPILAGRSREHMERYFDVFGQAILCIPAMLGPPASTIILAILTYEGLKTVIGNNETLALLEQPQYYMLSFNFTF